MKSQTDEIDVVPISTNLDHLRKRQMILTWLKQIERTEAIECEQGDFISVQNLDVLKEILEVILRYIEYQNAARSINPQSSEVTKKLKIRKEIINLFPEALRSDLSGILS